MSNFARSAVLVPFILVLAVLGFESKAAAQSSVIQAENQKPGTTDWILTTVKRQDDELYEKGWRRRTEIEGYASHTSVGAGDTLTLHVSTDPPVEYTVDIYRMGYYGGKGGRLMRSMGPFQGVTQPSPEDGVRNVNECKWTPGVKLEIPKGWVSGVYLGKLSTVKRVGGHAPDVGQMFESYVIFVVRDDRKADLMFQTSDLTWLAYNRWPQFRSLYDYGTDGKAPWGANNRRVGNDITFDRPYALFWNGYPAGFHPLTNGSGEFLVQEFPLAFWLEKEGYDVTYISNIDTHEDGEGLRRAKVFLSVGHDEYWTQQMFDNVAKARDEGVNLAFLSGNSVSGIIELLPSSSGQPNRIVKRAGKSFDDDKELMGASSYGVGFADWTCDKPDHWVFEGTGMKKGDHIPQLVGWEYHGPPLGSHPDLEVLSEGPVYSARGVQSVSTRGEPRQRTYATTLYTAKKGNRVFNASTCWWNMLLSSPPGFENPPRKYFQEDDPRLQRITKNILDKMISIQVTN
jgi:hypothetical protein